jgi:hypothetical protein
MDATALLTVRVGTNFGCSTTARPALSAKMPALGTGALVTSPIAVPTPTNPLSEALDARPQLVPLFARAAR